MKKTWDNLKIGDKLNHNMNKEKIIKELSFIINENSLENFSNTPDFILAEYLFNCLEIYNNTIKSREKYSGNLENNINIPTLDK